MEYSDDEKKQLAKYRTFYNAKNVGHQHLVAGDYFANLVNIRKELTAKYSNGGVGLDLCCGNGEYLIELNQLFSEIKGLDFSPELVEEANKEIKSIGITHAQAIEGNAKEMPFANENFDEIFSFSSLYYIPEVEKVIKECHRICKRDGICIFDFGIEHSLNHMVSRAYTEWADPFYISLSHMYEILKKHGFEIVEERAFQLLPYYGDKPKKIKRLLSPKWKAFMQKIIRGKMLDEWVCKLPIIGNFAFRRIVVCKKK